MYRFELAVKTIGEASFRAAGTLGVQIKIKSWAVWLKETMCELNQMFLNYEHTLSRTHSVVQALSMTGESTVHESESNM